MVQKAFEKKVKTKMSLISPVILKSVGEILTKGQQDHKNSEWIFMDPKDYLDSCLRHMNEVHRDVYSKNTEDGDKFHIEHLATDCIILSDIIRYNSQLDLERVFKLDKELVKIVQRTNLEELLHVKKFEDIIETDIDYINFKTDIYNASMGYVCSTDTYYRNRAKSRLLRIIKNVVTDKTLEINSMLIKKLSAWVVLNRFTLMK